MPRLTRFEINADYENLAARAIKSVEREGIVLENARLAVTNLADEAVGERIRGGWRRHPKQRDRL
jgi:hypothetical protein